MKPLRVGVNLLWLAPGDVGGSEEYVCRLLDGLGEVDRHELELTLFANKRFWAAHPTIANAHRLEVAAVSGRSRATRIARGGDVAGHSGQGPRPRRHAPSGRHGAGADRRSGRAVSP